MQSDERNAQEQAASSNWLQDPNDAEFFARLREAQDPPKRRIGRFSDAVEIGRGGQGVVYKAIDPATGEILALKRLRLPRDETQQLRFRREVDILKSLDHPGIVGVRGILQDSDQSVLTMEWVDGAPMSDWARTVRPFDPRGLAVLEKVACACDAVEYAHRNGIIHRDLKPNNVLVTATGQVKLLDFGLAKRFAEEDSTTQPGTLLGTPAYSAPEQLCPRTPVDTRADVYAMGVILYEALSGSSPYGVGLSFQELVGAVTEHPPIPISKVRRGLGRDLQVVLAKALEKDVGRRFPSAGALAIDLRNVAANRPIASRPPSILYLLSKAASRHRVAFLLALLGLISAIAFGNQIRSQQEDLNTYENLSLDVLARHLESGRHQTPSSMELQKALDELESKSSADHPLLLAARRSALADACVRNGWYQQAQTQLLLAEQEFIGQPQAGILQASATLTRVQLALCEGDLALADQMSIACQALLDSVPRNQRNHAATLSIRLFLSRSLLASDRCHFAKAREFLELAEHASRSLGAPMRPSLQCLLARAELDLEECHFINAERSLEEAGKLITDELDRMSLALLQSRLNLELGQLSDAEETIQVAQSIATDRLYPQHPARREVLGQAAQVLIAQSRIEEGCQLYQEFFGKTGIPLGAHPLRVRRHIESRAACFEGDLPAYQRYVQHLRLDVGPQHAALVPAQTGLAYLLFLKWVHQPGDLEERALLLQEMETASQQATKLARSLYGPMHRDVAMCLNQEGLQLKYQGRYLEARSRYEEAIAILDLIYGHRHPSGVLTRNNLAMMFIALASQAQQDHESSGSRDSLRELRHWAHQALDVYSVSRADAQQLFDPDHLDLGEAHYGTGRAAFLLGYFDLAEADLRCAIPIRQAHYPETSWRHIEPSWWLARVLVKSERFEEAVAILESVVAKMSTGQGIPLDQVDEARTELQAAHQLAKLVTVPQSR